MKCAPHGGFSEAFVLLSLSENVKIAAGTKLRQETKPFRRVDGSIKSRQKRMVKRLKYFSLRLCSSFLTPTNKLLLIHHFRREHRRDFSIIVKFRKINGTNIAGAETAGESKVRRKYATRR